MLTENQRLPNMLGQRLYNMLGQRLYNMLGQRFLDEQSADGFASPNQRWPNENCSLRPNVGPTSTCYLGWRHRTSTINNLDKLRLVCVLKLIYTCLEKMRKIINHTIEGGRRKSHPSDQDLQHPRLGKPSPRLQILDTRIVCPRPSLNMVLNSINLLGCSRQKQFPKTKQIWVI